RSKRDWSSDVCSSDLSGAGETAKEPRLDFLFRSRAARAQPAAPAAPNAPTGPAAPPEAFDTMWPRRGGRVPAEAAARSAETPPRSEERRVGKAERDRE